MIESFIQLVAFIFATINLSPSVITPRLTFSPTAEVTSLSYQEMTSLVPEEVNSCFMTDFCVVVVVEEGGGGGRRGRVRNGPSIHTFYLK